MTIKYQILQGDNRETLKTLADNSIDAIITDPPYGIDFLGKDWDANTGALETYTECLRVLKPGGHILAFSAARTYHHLAITLEQAGFEIRDQIMWIYSSGFPKSQDVGRQLHKKEHGKPDKQRFDPAVMIRVSGDQYQHPDTGNIYRALPDINGDRLAVSHEGKGYGVVYEQVIEVDSEWSGWGTQLKPAHEPIALARKPLRGSVKDNCVKWGVGAINIDATRIAYDDGQVIKGGAKIVKMDEAWSENLDKTSIAENNWTGDAQGRFPSNVIGEIAEPYQKYFYCPKVGRRERHIGHDNDSVPSHNEMAQAMGGSLVDHDGNPSVSGNKALLPDIGEIYTHGLAKHYADWCKNNGHVFEKGNNHPTVKPIELMKYLIRLITPPGGVVLDPFNGSGSTGCAAVELSMEYIGCELDSAYVDIARTRIEAWYAHTHPLQATGLFE